MVSENQRAESSSQSDKSTVLVVEDEVIIRMVISDHLRGCGYRVVEAGSGDETVAVLKTDIRIDVVFTAGRFEWVRPRTVGARGAPETARHSNVRHYERGTR
jgi:PleD family two-component response regulator